MKKKRKPGQGAGYSGVISPVVLAILVIVLFGENGLFTWAYEVDMSFVIFPSLVALAMVIASRVIGATLRGSLVPPLCHSLDLIGAGLFFSILLGSPPTPARIQPAWAPVLLLSLVGAAYPPLSFAARRHLIFPIVIKTLTLVLAGFLIRAAFLAPYPDGLEATLAGRPASIPVADIFFVGFLFAGAASALSVLGKLSNPYVSSSGDWLGSHKFLAFLLGAFFALYLLGLRGPLSDLMGARLLLVEWASVGLFCGAAYVGLRRAVGGMAEPMSFGSWAKHQQVEKVRKERGQVTVSELVKEFIGGGSKDEILVYLVSMASEGGVPRGSILSAVAELLNYRDAQVPMLTFRWEAERIRAENEERRKAVLEKTIKKLEGLRR